MRFASASETSSRLSARIVEPHDLGPARRDSMFTLFARHYDAVTRRRFESDLSEKDAVILLEDGTGAPVGFSTQKVLRVSVEGRPIRAIFSGDTIVDRAHWGDQTLTRAWYRYAADVLDREPGSPLYWFLISKGYRTYLYLPLNFRTFYPCVDWPTPPFERRILDALAFTKFSSSYNPSTGVIAFPESLGHLSADLAQVPPHRRDHKHVRFFLERNPGYVRGTELACLAEISAVNFNERGRRMFQAGTERR